MRYDCCFVALVALSVALVAAACPAHLAHTTRPPLCIVLKFALRTQYALHLVPLLRIHLVLWPLTIT